MAKKTKIQEFPNIAGFLKSPQLIEKCGKIIADVDMWIQRGSLMRPFTDRAGLTFLIPNKKMMDELQALWNKKEKGSASLIDERILSLGFKGVITDAKATEYENLLGKKIKVAKSEGSKIVFANGSEAHLSENIASQTESVIIPNFKVVVAFWELDAKATWDAIMNDQEIKKGKFENPNSQPEESFYAIDEKSAKLAIEKLYNESGEEDKCLICCLIHGNPLAEYVVLHDNNFGTQFIKTGEPTNLSYEDIMKCACGGCCAEIENIIEDIADSNLKSQEFAKVEEEIEKTGSFTWKEKTYKIMPTSISKFYKPLCYFFKLASVENNIETIKILNEISNTDSMVKFIEEKDSKVKGAETIKQYLENIENFETYGLYFSRSKGKPIEGKGEKLHKKFQKLSEHEKTKFLKELGLHKPN